MNIDIVTVGKIRQGAWHSLQQLYLKRLKHHARMSVSEIRGIRDSGGLAENVLIEKESELIASRIPSGSMLVALDSRGTALSSPELAEHLQRWRLQGRNRVAFAIGGAVGFSDSFLQRADFTLALSRMTLQHELAQIVLLEQLYRSFTIISGGRYHRQERE
ncbi:23S rRNA (pseudouridine(1915)-N(3))-methyltransferase RlmH [bacterium]|nr:23S rRNA (pseudouridine(1915)-N(3))-methyltransferase RlmH [bacterium]